MTQPHGFLFTLVVILYGLFAWTYGPLGVIAATVAVAGCLGVRVLLENLRPRDPAMSPTKSPESAHASRDGMRTRALIALLVGVVVVAIMLVVPGPSVPNVEVPGLTPDTGTVTGDGARTLAVLIIRDEEDATSPMGVPLDGRGLCLPYGAVGPWQTDGPYLIVTDYADRVVGVLEVGQGRWETGPEGSRCVVREQVVLPDAPFYTFTVGDVYHRTVIRSVLEAAGWTYEIEVDAP
jgi:hypothetical protein